MCVHAQLCLTLRPMDCSLRGSSIHGIFQMRILEGIAISYSSTSSDPGIELASPALAGRFFTTELPGKPHESDNRQLQFSIMEMCIKRGESLGEGDSLPQIYPQFSRAIVCLLGFNIWFFFRVEISLSGLEVSGLWSAESHNLQ